MSTATAPKPQATNGRMALGNIRSGKRREPDRIVLYGTEGVGKSTFGADAPKGIFLAAESGINHLDVASFPEPETAADIYEAIRVLRQEDHDYQTLIVDTVDWMEPILIREVCKRNDWKDIEDPGYGKGYTVMLDEWRKVIADFESLRKERAMEIILLAHAEVKPFNNPAGPDYDRFQMGMHKKSAALLKQWADTVLYACYEESVERKKGEIRVKGVSTGHRVMHTSRLSAWDAKNRYGLPDVLPLSYADYAAARDEGAPAPTATLAAEFDSLLKELKPAKAVRAQILGFVGDKSDPSTLARANDRMRALIEERN